MKNISKFTIPANSQKLEKLIVNCLKLYGRKTGEREGISFFNFFVISKRGD